MERSKFHVKAICFVVGLQVAACFKSCFKQDFATCKRATMLLGVPEVNGNTINEIPLT